MNISNFIVEILKSGRNVEIKGIGTFSPQTVEAHHDADKGVFYPKRRSVVFSNETTGDDYLLEALEKHECVNRDIAERMLDSYIDALKDKLSRTGSHVFNGMGTIVRCADGYAFSADPALDLSGNRQGPIQDVARYDSSDEADPFATYEENMQMVDASDEPTKEPRIITVQRDGSAANEAEPEPSSEPTAQASAEPEPVAAEPTAAEEVKIVVENPEPEVAATESEPGTPATEPEPEMPATESEPEPVRYNLNDEAEDAATATSNAEESEPFVIAPETNDDNAEAESTSQSDMDVLDALDNIPGSGGSIDTPVDSEPKRKKRTWLWILLALLLLLIGLGCYFYFAYRPAHGGTMESAIQSIKSDIASIRGSGSDIAKSIDDEEEDSDLGIVSAQDVETQDAEATEAEEPAETHPEEQENLVAEETEPVVAAEQTAPAAEPAPTPASTAINVNDVALLFSLSDNLIEFSDNDIDHGTRIVRNNLGDYVARFLAARRYTSAKAAMMDRVSAYAKKRFGELYNPNKFYADRLLAQKDDYVHDYLYNQLKDRREHRTCVTIQSELMQYSVLDQILNEMVTELGLQQDAVKAAAPVQIFPPKTAAEPQAQTVKASKQGFDIVAGFYTNKTTANRMATILKRQGCDAYIIDKQGLYYVSMGSAPTQTAAEALFRHIKSWYDGDIVIRKL